jgi:hypothetical protein
MNEDFVKALNEADLSLSEFLDVYSNEIEELIETGHCELTLGLIETGPCDLTLGNKDKVWKLYLTVKKD